MGPQLLSLVTVLVRSTQIYAETRHLYFSDSNHCDRTTLVARDEVIQIEEKRSSEAGDSVFADCSLLFRAGNLEDKLCMKISTLTFSNNKLQFQYFKFLDPTVGTPDLVYDATNPEFTKEEICDNEYEVSMRLYVLVLGATLGEVDLLIEIYNMQGNQRIAYIDTDCGLTYKMRDSTVFVQNTDPDGPNSHHHVCQLYFSYIGSNQDYTICINYQKTTDTCGYELRVFDGDKTGVSFAHTYTCSSDQPQQWCGTGASIYLELIVSGTDPLPVGVFAVEVKDATKDFTFPITPTVGVVLSTGAIIGIVVSCVAGLASILLVVLVRKMIRRPKISIEEKATR